MGSATQDSSIALFEKRYKVNEDPEGELSVHIESNADGVERIYQVFEDGHFVPAKESSFERTSATASAFVLNALAARHGAVQTEAKSSGPETISANKTASGEFDPQWADKVFGFGEGALYEIGRVVAVLEALRGGEDPTNSAPVLQFRRVQNRALSRPPGDNVKVPISILREAPAIIMSKRRALAKSAAMLSDCASKLRKWVKADDEFSDAFHFLRTKACGVRRSFATGAPLIDVGDGNFAEVKRLSAAEREKIAPHPDAMIDVDVTGDVGTTGGVPLEKRCLVRVATPPNTYLCVGLERLENDCEPVAAPVVEGKGLDDCEESINTLEGVLRRIRLARVSAFRKMTFERMIREAAEMTDATDFVTNSITVESGPYDILRVDRTVRQIAPSLDIGCDLQGPEIENFRKIQDASLLQMVILHQSITTIFSPKEHVKQGKGVFDRALITTCALSVVRALEKVLDETVDLLGVRVRWARGGARAEEARAFVMSDEADGDGPSRTLLAIEPLSTKNNGGRACTSGHVKLTPAFGVIIPAPDDPNARGRAAVLLGQSSSSSGGSPNIIFDDVPRSYVLPVYSGGEIVAAVTLVLCIRLLDALEMAARAGEAEVLDVDRQCFTVVVSSPQSGRTLRAKVWPKGEQDGHEVPATTAWLNGKVVDDFPITSPGRLVAWKKLLKRLVSDNITMNGPMIDTQSAQMGLLNGFNPQ